MRIQNLNDATMTPAPMDGVQGLSMAVMIGREHGAPHFAMRQLAVDPGGHSPRHSHDYEHEVIVLDGGGTFFYEGADHAITSGDVVYVPANTEHQFMAGADGLRFICLVPVEQNCGGATPGS